MKGWKADEKSEEGEDDEVRDFCKTGREEEETDKKMEGMRRGKNDQD